MDGITKPSSKTFGTILAEHNGVGPGFDIVRMGLAILIFVGHAKAISGHGGNGQVFRDHVLQLAAGNWEGPRRPLQVCLVPMFFAVSGFLVTGSALRLRRISTFLAFRGLRIFPALLVEVSLSASILGPIFTTLPLRDYFSNANFYGYFGNIFGAVDFYLPSVFINNHWPAVVNANLWTLPAEFDCYALMAVLMLVGVVYRRSIFLLMLVALSILFVFFSA